MSRRDGDSPLGSACGTSPGIPAGLAERRLDRVIEDRFGAGIAAVRKGVGSPGPRAVRDRHGARHAVAGLKA